MLNKLREPRAAQLTTLASCHKAFIAPVLHTTLMRSNGMANGIDPLEFAHTWMKAWNDHDVEAVLSHFRDDATFTSPLARRLGHGVDGVVTGKPAIRDYWTDALRANAELRFTTRTIYSGVDVIVINFEMEDKVERSEVLIFEGGLVMKGFGTVDAAVCNKSAKGSG